MKIFFSYKSEDINLVNEMKKTIEDISPNIQISTIRQSRKWKSLTKKAIAKADYFIYLAGEKYSENIDWEINTALKFGHQVYCVKLSENIMVSDDRLYFTQDYDNTKKILKINNPISIEELINILKGDSNSLQKKIFESGISDNTMLIEQYKALLSTSESLTERRQKLTTTYVSIFSILLPVISAMLSFSNLYLNIGAIAISLICIVLCVSWRSTIISYGKLNRAKFAILEEIEHKLPTAMFASEWYALKKITVKYKSFTNRETSIPFLFILVYSVLAVLSAFMLFINL